MLRKDTLSESEEIQDTVKNIPNSSSHKIIDNLNSKNLEIKKSTK